MKPFAAISVDDEPGSHGALRELLNEIEDVDLVATFLSPEEALAALPLQRCDLLFLDVAMPGMSGLEFLMALQEPPVTVLLTAHMEFALKAFELGVRDYLLKPVSAQRLNQCIDNIRPLLKAGRESGLKAPARLSLKCGNGHCLIDPLKTFRVEAAGNFSTVFGESGHIFVSETMKDLQRRLEPLGFLRIHKSHLANVRFVSTIGASEVELRTGARLPVGRTYRAALSGLAIPR